MIPVRILTDDDVRSMLDIRSAVESVEKAYAMKASNKARLFPLISEDLHPGSADMDIKSGVLNEEDVFGLKLVTWFGENVKIGLGGKQETDEKIFDDAVVFVDDIA